MLPTRILPVLLMISVCWSCRSPSTPSEGLGRIRLATTTSTENSGLLRDLLLPFEKRYKARIQVIAVGTGKAFELGRRGDVDLLMVHDSKREEKYVAEGNGVCRRTFMYNLFVLLGPPSDPARLAREPDVISALRKLARSSFLFLSRDDGSGTHAAEKRLWQEAKVQMPAQQYLQAGVGMGQALMMASQKGAYTLADSGTFYALKSKLELSILSKPEPRLRNPYSVMAVNPTRHPHTNHVGALALLGYLTSAGGQKRIGRFLSHGKTLFFPLLTKP